MQREVNKRARPLLAQTRPLSARVYAPSDQTNLGVERSGDIEKPAEGISHPCGTAAQLRWWLR